MKLHRKCDSDKYRRLQRAQRTAHLDKVKRRKEVERKEHELAYHWRRDQELIQATQRREKERSLQRMVNLLCFRIWQLDPAYYNHWSRMHALDKIAKTWGMIVPWSF